MHEGRSPLVLTERNDHPDALAVRLSGVVRLGVVHRGGMGRKRSQSVSDRLVEIRTDVERVLLATGKYVGEGFDDPPFDESSTMEFDLLCVDARVAVELDGAQHLADPAAYRRDRRKARFLRVNGYLVLRFLAEDVSKDLDSVLDAIYRALVNRRQA